MARRRHSFLNLLGAAALVGAAVGIVKISKEAKEKEMDPVDLAKEKVNKLMEDIKSGEFANQVEEAKDKVTDFVDKTVEDAKSGELSKNIQDKFNQTFEEIKSGETYEKASKFANDLKDSVTDFFDSKEDDEEKID